MAPGVRWHCGAALGRCIGSPVTLAPLEPAISPTRETKVKMSSVSAVGRFGDSAVLYGIDSYARERLCLGYRWRCSCHEHCTGGALHRMLFPDGQGQRQDFLLSSMYHVMEVTIAQTHSGPVE